MTLQEIYIDGKRCLQKAGNETPAFDAFCLFAQCFGLDRGGLAVHGKEQAPPEKAADYQRMIERRAQGYPLQYLLGEWEFMGMPFLVGPGVLIPRDDTEAVVFQCARRLEANPSPNIVDLCAGSGAVSIGLCSLLPGARVTAVELSLEAFGYLEKNINRNHMDRVTAVRGDVLRDFSLIEDGTLDAVVSNPPYIPSGDMPGLQKEVRWEPEMALNGGGDGLNFYRAIVRHWIRKLKLGGVVAVEIGIHQEAQVVRLFEQAGLRAIEVKNDLGGIPRSVSGALPEDGTLAQG